VSEATRLAVIGDTHFGRVDDAALQALLRDLRAAKPALIIVAGDLTQRARRSEFRAARAFLQSLPSPWLVIPGNHDLPLFDLPRRLLSPYGRYRRYIARELEPTVLLPQVGVLGVDATRRLSHKKGVLGPRQIARAAQRLRQIDRPFRIVAVHQPLAVESVDDLDNLTRGSDRALPAWLDAGVDLIVGGHVHRGYCIQVGERRTGLVVQAGTSVSTRRRHGLPNSYFQLELRLASNGARQVHVLQRDHDARRACFDTRAHDLAISTPGGWQLGGVAYETWPKSGTSFT
jgi:3',5'-cyclic AMP phosphodiesterase CpdA